MIKLMNLFITINEYNIIVHNINTMCHSMVELAQTSLVTETTALFEELFRLFSGIYNKTMFQRKIGQVYSVSALAHKHTCCPIDGHIKKFMEIYRQNFPHATVLPKMHMLEEHVLPWLRKWHVGFGLLGEQGIESIHAHFNSPTEAFQRKWYDFVTSWRSTCCTLLQNMQLPPLIKKGGDQRKISLQIQQKINFYSPP